MTSPLNPARARVAELWLQSPTLSVIEIGQLLGISKNAVVGLAHRMGLPGRPSPIHRGDAPRPPRPVRAPKATLPALPAVAEQPAPASAPPPPPPPPLPPAMPPRRPECQWPTWRAKDGGYWRAVLAGGAPTCGAPVRLKRSARGELVPCVYCAAHAKQAFDKHTRGYATNGQLRAMAEAPPQGRMHETLEALNA